MNFHHYYQIYHYCSEGIQKLATVTGSAHKFWPISQVFTTVPVRWL